VTGVITFKLKAVQIEALVTWTFDLSICIVTLS